MKKSVLTLENIEAKYGALPVLYGVQLRVFEGDILTLIGPNGAGKSTVLKVIYGLVQRTQGHIIFQGKHLERIKPHQLMQLGIAYVPQGRVVFSSLTVEENLEMGAFILHDAKRVRERIREIFAQFPILREKRKERAGSLSGGLQQLLSIARAFMVKPKLLLIDEPSLGLAPKMVEEVFQKIKDINKQGTTIIVVEQNAHKALEVCTRAYVLEQGRIALEGGKNLAQDKRVQHLYLGGA